MTNPETQIFVISLPYYNIKGKKMNKKLTSVIAAAFISLSGFVYAGNTTCCEDYKPQKAKVYFTRDISPKGILKIYNAINSEITGKVAIKVHTGEPHGQRGEIRGGGQRAGAGGLEAGRQGLRLRPGSGRDHPSGGAPPDR